MIDRIPVRYLLRIVTLVGMATLLILACTGSDDDDNDSNTPRVILPLDPGNTWTWNSTTYLFTWTVTDVTTLQGQEVTIVTNDFINHDSGEHSQGLMYFRNDEDGLYLYGINEQGQDEIYNPPRLYMKYPLTVGETFVDGWGTTYTVVSLSQSVTVPAGTFQCISLTASTPTGNPMGMEYWAEDIGMIKIDIPPLGYLAELQSYSFP